MNRILQNRHAKIFPAINVCLLIILLFIPVRAEREERSIESWQPLHFDVQLVFLDDKLEQIDSATAAVTTEILSNNVSLIDFDFGTMPVSAVRVDGKTAKFAQQGEKLNVFLAEPAQKNQKLNIQVLYSGKPQDGLILTNDRDGNPSAVGDNWGDRVHHWIPCLDHPSAKASVRFTVTAPENLAVVANGVLESTKNNVEKTKTWVWFEPAKVSPYNMVIAVGKFANQTLGTKSAIPISYYVPQSDRQFAAQGFSPAAPSVETYSRLIAPYPYQKLALIIGATRFGGMENANTIVFSPNLFKDFVAATPRGQRYQIPSSVEVVVAHEIAHQWFGNSVTEKTWADLWLSEGFATYFAGIFLEQNESPAAFRKYMTDNAVNYFKYAETRRAPIHDPKTEKLFDLLNPNNYEKGAWVLHMLRGELGDKDFFAGLRKYYNAHQGSTATTEDLRAALESASGKNLKNFFDRWIYQAGHPVYGVSWRETSKQTIEITLKQTQDEEFFAQPVTLAVATNKTTKRVVITPMAKETTIKFKSAKPKNIIIDPDDFILNEIKN